MALKISEKVSASIPVFGTRMNSMKTCRIHIMGASGAGVTSLGRALADALALSHHDADDYFWRPTTPPYREMREVADRLRDRCMTVALELGGWNSRHGSTRASKTKTRW